MRPAALSSMAEGGFVNYQPFLPLDGARRSGFRDQGEKCGYLITGQLGS